MHDEPPGASPSAVGSSRGLGRFSLSRLALVWLVGVLVLVLVLTSALVLLDESRFLTRELEDRTRALARLLAVAAAEDGNPSRVPLGGVPELRWARVEGPGGAAIWRFGTPDVAGPGAGFLRVVERVPAREGGEITVVAASSTARIRIHVLRSGLRLVLGLAAALAVALLVGAVIFERVTAPLNELARRMRTFHPDDPLPAPGGAGGTREIVELASSFREMADRLARQRRSLVRSERSFRELFESSPSPLLLFGPDGLLERANPAAAGYLHTAPGEVPRLRDLVGAGDGGRPGGPELPEEAGGEAVSECSWRLPGGGLARVELRIRRVEGEEGPRYLVALHDLTERLRALERRWQRTFDEIEDGVALVDPGGTVTQSNRALTPHLRAVADELRSRAVREDRQEWEARSGGRTLRCTLTVPGSGGHRILVVRDVTEELAAEERLRQAQKMEAVATLAGGVAHDFNNLLTGVLLHVRLLEHGRGDGETLAAIRRLAEEGIEVVGELLLFARRESTPARRVDLAALVRSQAPLLRHLVPGGVELQVETPGEAVPVEASPVGLRRALFNLVLNARDAVEPPSGRITVNVEAQGKIAILRVTDNGSGIPADVRERLFEPFWSSRREGRGAGLGLAVVYAVVQQHGGEILVDSAPGQGTCMTLRFPLAPSSPGEEGLETDAGGTPDPLRRLLLVDAGGRDATPLAELLSGRVGELRHAASPDQVAEILAHWPAQGIVLVQRRGSGLGLPEAVASPEIPTVLLVEEGVPREARWSLRTLVAEAALPLDPGEADRLLAALRDAVDRAPGAG